MAGHHRWPTERPTPSIRLALEHRPPYQLGVAPDAKLLSIKLATTDGSTDVSQVMTALDWVTEHPIMPDGTRVRVINLSYGTDSRAELPARSARRSGRKRLAPRHRRGHLCRQRGRGNRPTHRLPAYDPSLVAAVGAADASNRTDGWSHDHTRAAAFSNVSSTRHVDLLAPGTSVVSTRDPGSYIDQNNPQGSSRVTQPESCSAAAAPARLQQWSPEPWLTCSEAYPTLTPDQVKFALVSSADASSHSQRLGCRRWNHRSRPRLRRGTAPNRHRQQ